MLYKLPPMSSYPVPICFLFHAVFWGCQRCLRATLIWWKAYLSLKLASNRFGYWWPSWGYSDVVYCDFCGRPCAPLARFGSQELELSIAEAWSRIVTSSWDDMLDDRSIDFQILNSTRPELQRLQYQACDSGCLSCLVTTLVVRFRVGCLIFILIYVHRFLTSNLEPWNFEPEQLRYKSVWQGHIIRDY